MIVPNKVIPFNESIVGKMPVILKELKKEDIKLTELYLKVQEDFEEIDEFIYSLEALFLLDAINVDFKKGVVKYVKRN
ncbi:hypothetical protein M3196_11835 [Fictibacillus nanhaiensis]|uniref:ABC-three component system middle component 7 n=1 Tax=Fictibacillus nanhaiensis TaxID=742169 RepID=UPI00203B5D74|nr:ABC-three component system middle component 7 [Fictibacillus nanhaiensis]MCM3732352.1 hypothetical protein [Fictibacillus nanhaiensis]